MTISEDLQQRERAYALVRKRNPTPEEERVIAGEVYILTGNYPTTNPYSRYETVPAMATFSKETRARQFDFLLMALRKYLPRMGLSDIADTVINFAENPIIQIFWKDQAAKKFKREYKKIKNNRKRQR